MGVWKRLNPNLTGAMLAAGWGAFVCLAGPSLALAQGVRLIPTLEKGKNLTYEVSRSLRVEQTPIDNAPKAEGAAADAAAAAKPAPSISESTLNLVLRLDVGSVRADGTTEVAVQIQSLKVRMLDGGVERVFVHPKDEAGGEERNGVGTVVRGGVEPPDAPKADAPPAAPDDKPPSALQLVGAALAASSPRVVINREGGVSDILGLDNLAQMVDDARKADRSLSRVAIESIGPWALRQALMPIFAPAAPEPASRRFAPGDTWTVRHTRDLGSIGSVVIDEGWTMSGEGGDGVAKASGTPSVRAEEPRGIVSASPTLKIESSSGSHELLWDTGAGDLSKLSRSVEITTLFTLGDLTLRQRQVSSMVVERP